MQQNLTHRSLFPEIVGGGINVNAIVEQGIA